MITKVDIFDMLESCNIRHNDVVTIHCSLKSIGDEIYDGADGMIDAFCEYLYDGLFIVPTHTWDNVTKENPYYDVKASVPCIGVLAKVAAFRSDAKRSLHPTHSVAVFGKRAEEYVKGEESSASPAPVGGCLSRLYEENGKIILIGVGHERNTYLHAIDERLKIPNRLNPNTFTISIKDENGNYLESPPFHTHYTAGISTCCSDFYPNYKEAFDYFGAVTYATLGKAKVSCCDARKMTDIARMLWARTDHDLCISNDKIPYEYYKK